MLAVKNRRASDFVAAPAKAPGPVVLSLDAAVEIMAVPSPARALQAELAARLAGEVDRYPQHSVGWRIMAIGWAATLCWMPLLVVAALIVA